MTTMVHYERKFPYLFFDFEGIDGAGKDAQITKLVDMIKEDDNGLYGNKYRNIWTTREPTMDSEEGRLICTKLKGLSLSAEEAAYLFVTDRKKHTHPRIVEDHLAIDSDVITSRYDLSTDSFQMTQGLSFDELYEMHSYYEKDGCIIPDMTIVVDTTPEVAAQRRGKRKGTKEFFETADFQKKVRDNLLYCVDKLREYDGRNIIVVNGNQSIDAVAQEMYEKLKGFDFLRR